MIRKATEEDIPVIKQLMQSEPDYWNQDSRPDALRIALGSAKDLAFVWDEEGSMLGFICAHDLGFRAYLSELIVHRSARRRGIGKQLVQRVQDELVQRKCPVLFSDVWRTAEMFYRSLGWSEPKVTLLRIKLEGENSQPPAI